MKRRSFVQALTGAGIAVPLSQYLAIARPFNPSESLVLEAPLGIGDQIMMIFPDEQVFEWFLLVLKPGGKRIRIQPGDSFRKFWIYSDPVRTGTQIDAKGDTWAVYGGGEMVFAFRYFDNLIRTRRISDAPGARFRIEDIKAWTEVEGKTAYEIAWGAPKGRILSA